MKLNMQYFGILVVAVICLFGQGECGECCRIRNPLTSDTDEKWCSDFCCVTLQTTYCCSEQALQAPTEDRLPFCGAWFSAYVWVPIVVSIGIVVLCVGCCVCCCRACCGRQRDTVIVQGMPTGGTTVVAQQQTAMMSPVSTPSPYNAGYNQP
ncbi:protein shisa-5-like [Saccostrea echinata]|uniref:protein shisa-5-like n=1 Tax=Saccostrea echinata TaxID=191078 RepID=UPI002A81E5CC|nr:protein shisa-5-like [Saccostrea echinata]